MSSALIELEIRVDEVTDRRVVELLEEHMRCMVEASPPESRHALDLDGLRQRDVTFWTAWDGAELAGCGALKELDRHHGEVKSMRTAYVYQRRGVASQILEHLIIEAQKRGYRRLSLETGSMSYFEPARRLYRSFGFEDCAPFGSYQLDPNSVYMTRRLDEPAAHQAVS